MFPLNHPFQWDFHGSSIVSLPILDTPIYRNPQITYAPTSSNQQRQQRPTGLVLDAELRVCAWAVIPQIVWGTPRAGWFIRENPIKMDDVGNLHIYIYKYVYVYT